MRRCFNFEPNICKAASAVHESKIHLTEPIRLDFLRFLESGLRPSRGFGGRSAGSFREQRLVIESKDRLASCNHSWKFESERACEII